MSETRSALCPICWHEETMRARLAGRERCPDDPQRMIWRWPPGGGRGQVVTRWDGGWWECGTCGAMLSPTAAGVALDAALMCSDPDCDSIVDGVHEDVRIAMRGGRP